MIKYSKFNNKAHFIRTNTVYGFYLSRSAQNVIVDSWTNTKKKVGLSSPVEEAISWSPEDHYHGIRTNGTIVACLVLHVKIVLDGKSFILRYPFFGFLFIYLYFSFICDFN
ncbi:hypothetical protein NGRA_3527 [Nosema granulosis]|uniref:Uncharacterized protein n=1 Tax=Nosema granulosis TaxID=83296 RepID=A0A9P6GV35_9MICR|nr:hypothetical protein NGRA_3527 [Nosema granulosis]